MVCKKNSHNKGGVHTNEEVKIGDVSFKRSQKQ